MRCESTHRGLQCEKTAGHDGVHEACNVDNHAWSWWNDKTSPGHGGAGQTADGKEGEDPADGREESVPGPVDGGSSPARDAVPPSTWLPPGAAPAEPLCERLPLVESPYERILLPAGGVRFRRTEEPIVKLLREVGREIDQKLEDEDPGYFERVRARLFGGGGS